MFKLNLEAIEDDSANGDVEHTHTQLMIINSFHFATTSFAISFALPAHNLPPNPSQGIFTQPFDSIISAIVYMMLRPHPSLYLPL